MTPALRQGFDSPARRLRTRLRVRALYESDQTGEAWSALEELEKLDRSTLPPAELLDFY